MSPIRYYQDTDPWTQTNDAKLAGYTGPGWYFWDETWSHMYGPYLDQEKGKASMDAYLKELR